MALRHGFLLLLWDLALFVHCVMSFCDVTCSTDYNVSLNCSCTGSAPTHSVLLEVNCSDTQLEVNGICELKPPQSWCVMYPDLLYEVASIGTTCTAKVSQQGDQIIVNQNESSTWELSEVVKPLPPFDVQVTDNESSYNITWGHNNQIDCLTYRVRIRESKDLSKNLIHSFSLEEKHILIDRKKLQPHVNYTVDVKAKLCPGYLYEGPWSEWSSTAKWQTKGTSEMKGLNWRLFSIPPLFIILMVVLALKPYLVKKFQMITYIPRPDEFFKPLYHNYGGDFKEWVKPVFSEFDYLRISSQVQMKSEKQHDVLQWDDEKPNYREDSKMNQDGHCLQTPQPHSNSLLFFQGGSSSQGNSHSISIHTVTLSGEEEFEGEVVSQSSVSAVRSDQDGESFGLFIENGEPPGFELEEPLMARFNRQSGVLSHHDNQMSNASSEEILNILPCIQFIELAMGSLESLALNEQSDDGYPHVDLDTIDSGLGECSSPGASDSNGAELKDSELFPELKSSNSNYVRQWMACSTVETEK